MISSLSWKPRLWRWSKVVAAMVAKVNPSEKAFDVGQFINFHLMEIELCSCFEFGEKIRIWLKSVFSAISFSSSSSSSPDKLAKKTKSYWSDLEFSGNCVRWLAPEGSLVGFILFSWLFRLRSEIFQMDLLKDKLFWVIVSSPIFLIKDNILTEGHYKYFFFFSYFIYYFISKYLCIFPIFSLHEDKPNLRA